MAASKSGEGRASDLSKSGRVNTKVETQTQVVDHTESEAQRRPTDYHSSSVELGGGTTIVTYGEPKGEAPASEGEDA